MIGVILWSDPVAGSAVIWCEDHGDLAYCKGLREQQSAMTSGAFDAGDLVVFDIQTDGERRTASNVESLSGPQNTTAVVSHAVQETGHFVSSAGARFSQGAEVISLSARKTQSGLATAEISRRG